MPVGKIIAGALALTLSSVTMAADSRINNNYVQLDLGVGSFRNDNDKTLDTIGYELEGSYLAMPELLLRGSLGKTDENESKRTKPDIDTIKLGASWLPDSGDENVNIDAGLRYRRDDLGNNKIDGWGVGVGIRAMATERLEVTARIDWLENDYDGSIDAELGAAWHFTEQFALSLGYEQLDYKGFDRANYKDRQWQLGGRYSF